VLPTPLGAQTFEGTIRMRSVTIDATPVLARYGNDPEKLIAAPWERILAAARDAGANIDEDSGVYYIKGSRLRFGGGSFTANAYMVTDVTTGAMLMIQPAERVYIEWGPEDIQKMMEEIRAGAPETQEPAPEFEPLGTTREVHGRRCAEYQMTEEQTITVACLTKELAGLASFFQQWGKVAMDPTGEEGRNVIAALTKHGFPLLVRELTTEGDEQTMSAAYEINETISIDRGALPESLFTTPPGFRKTTLPGSP
jgi:hypothetical protein